MKLAALALFLMLAVSFVSANVPQVQDHSSTGLENASEDYEEEDYPYDNEDLSYDEDQYEEDADAADQTKRELWYGGRYGYRTYSYGSHGGYYGGYHRPVVYRRHYRPRVYRNYYNYYRSGKGGKGMMRSRA
jgi:hypothetical protein